MNVKKIELKKIELCFFKNYQRYLIFENNVFVGFSWATYFNRHSNEK